MAQGCGLASKSPIVEGLMLRTCAYTTIACAGDGSRATDGPISSNFRASPISKPAVVGIRPERALLEVHGDALPQPKGRGPPMPTATWVNSWARVSIQG